MALAAVRRDWRAVRRWGGRGAGRGVGMEIGRGGGGMVVGGEEGG